ncbi:hypothetical protein TNCV_700911 [Trichonephila clavipes]|nr:hypothetical protein TNCV_700911 [Trichonephila clavipes]
MRCEMDECTRYRSTMSTQVQAAYKQAFKSVSAVISRCATIPRYYPYSKNNPTIRDLVIVTTVDLNPHVQSTGSGMPYPANPVQKHRNA